MQLPGRRRRATLKFRILGIDPGLRVTGYGVIELGAKRPSLVEAGIVTPTVSKSLEGRLHELYTGIVEVMVATQPTHIVIEALFSAYKNPLTAVMMGHARGVLCLAAEQHGVRVNTLGHSLVKRALVGSGAARKDQVNAMVTQMLGLVRPPQPNDVSDALALALAFSNACEHEERFPVAMALARR